MLIENLSKHPGCVETIAAWHHQEWCKHRDTLSRTENQNSLNKRICALKEHLDVALVPSTFVCLDQDKPVGSASVVFYQFSQNQAKSSWLTNVFVANAFRHRGMGTRLVSYACEQAKRSGLKKLMLYTYDQEAFYIRRGWTPLETKTLQKRPVQVLEKVL